MQEAVEGATGDAFGFGSTIVKAGTYLASAATEPAHNHNAAFTTGIRRMAAQRTVIMPEAVPSYVSTDSPIIDAFMNAYNRTVQTGTFVAYNPSFTGKTVATRRLLQRAPRGIMICATGIDQVYPEYVAEKIGARGDTNKWLYAFVNALGSKPVAQQEEDDNDNRWWNQLASKLTHIFAEYGGAPSIIDDDLTFDGDGDPSNEDAAVLIFDDFNFLDPKGVNEAFAREVYRMSYNLNLMVFFVTHNEHVANVLCNLNGWGRIKPLPDAINGDITVVTDPPNWNRMPWTAVQLTVLVVAYTERYRTHFTPLIDPNTSSLPFLTNGMTSSTALQLAERQLQLAAGGVRVV
jgi:hypothetical protein